MFEAIFGSEIRVRVLLYLFNKKEGYAREISRFCDTDLNQIQKQLERLEEGSIIQSRTIGKTRLYVFNPLFPLLPELEALLRKVAALQQSPGIQAPAALVLLPEVTASLYESYDPDLVD